MLTNRDNNRTIPIKITVGANDNTWEVCESRYRCKSTVIDIILDIVCIEKSLNKRVNGGFGYVECPTCARSFPCVSQEPFQPPPC